MTSGDRLSTSRPTRKQRYCAYHFRSRNEISGLHPDAAGGLQDFAPDLVVLAGSTVVLSPQVEADAQAAGYDTRRVGGVTRTETARLLNALPAELGVAYLPIGASAADAAALGARPPGRSWVSWTHCAPTSTGWRRPTTRSARMSTR